MCLATLITKTNNLLQFSTHNRKSAYLEKEMSLEGF